MGTIDDLDPPVICAEAPVALVCSAWGIYPLTPCCQACATGTDGGVACKGCWNYVDAEYGDCWDVGDERGWSNYEYLLEGAIQVDQLCTVGRTDPAAARAKACEIATYARSMARAKVG